MKLIKNNPKLFLLSSIYFLLIFGNVLGINIGNSLFLSSPAGGIKKLPYMYIVFSFLTSLISFSFIFFIDRWKRDKIFIVSFSVISLFPLFIFFFAQNIKEKFWTYFIYLTVQIIWQISIMLFWTIANDTCNTREAKQIFPLISSAGLIGSISSGFLSGALLLLYPTSKVILLWTLTSILLLFFFRILKRKYQVAFETSIENKNNLIKEFAEGIKQFFTTPFFLGLAFLVFNMWLILYICDFYYFDVTSNSLQQQRKLASLYSLVRGSASFLAILIQLFLTRKLLSKIGPSNSIFIFPISIALVLIINIIKPFWLTGAIILRIIRISLVYSIQDSVYQIFFNVIDDKYRGRIRLFIDGVAIPLSIAFSGLTLIILNTYQVKSYLFIALPLLALWLCSAFILKKNYLSLLISNLTSSHNNELKFITLEYLANLKSKATLSTVIKVIKSDPNPNVKINALKILQTYPFSEEIFEILKEELKNQDPFVKSAVVDVLGHFNNQKVIDLLFEVLQKEKVGRVKATTIRILSQIVKKEEIIPVIKNNLYHEDPRISANAIEVIKDLALDDFKEELEKLLQHPNNRVKANTIITIWELSAYSSLKSKALKTLSQMLNSETILMKSSALYTISFLKLEQFSKNVLKILDSNDKNSEILNRNILKTIKALKIENFLSHAYKMVNTPIKDELLELLKDHFPRKDKEWLKQQLEQEIKKLPDSSTLKDFIPFIPYLDNSEEFFLKILKNTEDTKIINQTLETIIPLKLEKLKPLIKEKFLSHSDSKIRLQAIKFLCAFASEDEYKIVLEYLKDSDPRIRATILDCFFQHKFSPPLNLILPLLEDKNNRVKATAAKLLYQIGISQGKLTLLKMFRSEDKWEKINAIYAMGDLKSEEFMPFILQASRDSDLDIQKNAMKALQKFSPESQDNITDYLDSFKNIKQNKISNILTKIIYSPQDPLLLIEQEDLDEELKIILKETLLQSKDFLLNSPLVFSNNDVVMSFLQSKDPYLRNITLNSLDKLEINKDNNFIHPYISSEIKQIQENLILIQKLQKMKEKYHNISLLIEEIQNMNNIIKENIFLLLKLKWKDEKLFIIQNKLEDSNIKIRANALEAIESIINDKEILKLLIPFLEKIYLEKNSNHLTEEKFNLEDINYLIKTITFTNQTIKKISLNIIREIVIGEVILPLIKISHSSSSKTKNLIEQILEDIKEMASLYKFNLEIKNLIDNIDNKDIEQSNNLREK